ncbi:MAG: hypothetical protein HPY30_12560 [Gammaproteobacteria bacterium (ex Lamellibrachia satsuma)]|nr:MAG: hypothetical protein HPY30_12560 [Gammaproteobacteria bacterium (ex Lamellibrachia satsuma)]
MPQRINQCGSETQCHHTRFRWRWPDGFVCPECGHVGYCGIA